MKLFLVYAEPTPIGVYSTLDKAKEVVEKWAQDIGLVGVEIWTMHLDASLDFDDGIPYYVYVGYGNWKRYDE